MINSIGDDMNIADFRRLWLSKKGEFGEMFGEKVEVVVVTKDSVEKEPSAYVKFCRERRQELKDRNPELKGIDITRELARLWKIYKVKGKNIQEEKKQEVVKVVNEGKQAVVKEVNVSNEGKQAVIKEVNVSNEGNQAVVKEVNVSNEGKPVVVKEVNVSNEGKPVVVKEVNVSNEGKQVVVKEKKAKKIKDEIPKTKKITRAKKVESKSTEDPEFIQYCNENRMKIKEKYPDMSPLEITRELATEWKKHRMNYNDNLQEIRNIINQAMGL
jgi:hypothetical protein